MDFITKNTICYYTKTFSFVFANVYKELLLFALETKDGEIIISFHKSNFKWQRLKIPNWLNIFEWKNSRKNKT